MAVSKFSKFVRKIYDLDGEIIEALRVSGQYSHKVKESFPYIPFDDTEDLKVLLQFLCLKIGHAPILDVGAGTGSKVKIFKEMGYPAAGVEFHAPYVKIGRKQFGLSSDELILGDAFKLTSEFLSPFRIIYTYMPIRDGRRMTELHMHLFQNSAPGTIFAEMLPRYYPMNMSGTQTRHFLESALGKAKVYTRFGITVKDR